MEKDVPYLVFEGQMARNERSIKRLIIALIIAVILIFATNMAWLYAWNLYDYSTDCIIEIIDFLGTIEEIKFKRSYIVSRW